MRDILPFIIALKRELGSGSYRESRLFEDLSRAPSGNLRVVADYIRHYTPSSTPDANRVLYFGLFSEQQIENLRYILKKYDEMTESF